MSVAQFESCAQAAIQYALQGWKVFPLQPLSKRPLLPVSWTDIATIDLATIIGWWAEYPTANIAVVAGDTLCIVDVDMKHGDGWAAVGAYIDQETPWVATPSGGWHFYYKAATDVVRGLPGLVDVQQGNHYVVAPPSVLQDTPESNPVTYLWGQDSGVPVKPVPENLKSFLGSVPRETTVSSVDQPLLLDSDQIPEWPRARLTRGQLEFLTSGHVVGYASRSEVVHGITSQLYKLGYSDAEVLSLLMQADYTRQTALEHRQNDWDGAVAYLWAGCRKVRDTAHREPEAVFGPLSDPRQADKIKALIDRAARLGPHGDPREILRDLALEEVDPIEEDMVLLALKNQGHTKQRLSQTLSLYRNKRKTQEKGGKGPQWRHVTGEDERPLGTVENLQALLDYRNTSVRYNLMNHHIEIDGHGIEFVAEEKLNAQLTMVRSWAAENRLPLDTIKEQIAMLAQKEPYHPFQEYLRSAPWDGQNRLQNLLNTIKVPKEKVDIRRLLVTRWMLSVVASVEGYGNRPPRGVLTFTGDQWTGKTTWLYYLVPKGMYKQGLLLRPDNRDLATQGLRYLIAEIGEIGSTFKKADMEILKAYIGQREDRYRLPYAHEDSVWPRRTIFAASSNDYELLHDQTGNTRWWVLPVEGFDLDTMERWWGQEGRGADLQQIWAEVYQMYLRGDNWDLTDIELMRLDRHLDAHVDDPPIVHMLKDTYEWGFEPPRQGYPHSKTIGMVLRDMGLSSSRILNTFEHRQLLNALKKLTGQRKAVLRRVNLATENGERVGERDSRGKPARFWNVPPVRVQDSANPPFKPQS